MMSDGKSVITVICHPRERSHLNNGIWSTRLLKRGLQCQRTSHHTGIPEEIDCKFAYIGHHTYVHAKYIRLLVTDMLLESLEEQMVGHLFEISTFEFHK